MVLSKTIDVDGLSIFYRDAGRQDAPVILLLHGFPSSSHMFRDLIPLLAEDFRVIAPDYPGFGYSDAPGPSDFEYTFDNVATVVDRLTDLLRIDRYIIYMQDYGGPIGLRLATAHPERVNGLVVQNANAYDEGISAAFESLKPFWANRNPETEQAARALLSRDTTLFQYTHGARHPERVSPDAWTHDQALLDRPGNDAIQLAMLHDYPSNLALYPKWQEYLRTHRPPTLVVSGKNDPFFLPAGQEAFTRDVPDAEVNLLDAGHFALEEAAEEIAATIKRFVAARAAEPARTPASTSGL